jgi:hypothetical protein
MQAFTVQIALQQSDGGAWLLQGKPSFILFKQESV